jgi:hypothetical protein
MTGVEFIRGAGVVTSRRLGGSPLWLGENVYCNFRRVVTPQPDQTHRSVYVRCFGSPWGYRLDLGFDVRDLSDGVPAKSQAVARALLQRLVAVAGAAPISLGVSYQHIARAVESRTQPQVSTPSLGDVRPGTPVVLIEEIVAGAGKPQVAMSQVTVGGRPIDILQIRRSLDDPKYDETWSQVRHFRLAWWRAHSELEILRLILHAWRTKELPATPEVRDILVGLGDGLARWRRFGVDQSQFMAWRASQHRGDWDALTSLAGQFVEESAGISRKISIGLERAQAMVAAQQLVANLQQGTPVDLELFTTRIHIQDSRNFAVGTGATVSNAPSRAIETRENDDMDPVTLIVAALVAGATAGVGDVATQAITDAYGGLKSMVKAAFKRKGDEEGAALVEQHASDPDAVTEPLKEKLRVQEIAQDPQIIEAARALLRDADAAGFQAGKYDVQIKSGQGFIVGDNAHQTNTFGAATPAEDASSANP